MNTYLPLESFLCCVWSRSLYICQVLLQGYLLLLGIKRHKSKVKVVAAAVAVAVLDVDCDGVLFW